MSSAVLILVKLQGLWIRELRTIVSQQDRHNPHKDVMAKFEMKVFKDSDDGLRIVGLSQKGKHEFCLHEMKGKKNLAPFTAFYGVHFHNRQVGVLVEEMLKVMVGSADSASLVHFELLFYLALGIAYFPRHIYVSSGENIKVNQAIEGAFANHE